MSLWIMNKDETIMIKVDRVDVRGTSIYGYGNTTTYSSCCRPACWSLINANRTMSI